MPQLPKVTVQLSFVFIELFCFDRKLPVYIFPQLLLMEAFLCISVLVSELLVVWLVLL